jgi:hypothetical protein
MQLRVVPLSVGVTLLLYAVLLVIIAAIIAAVALHGHVVHAHHQTNGFGTGMILIAFLEE